MGINSVLDDANATKPEILAHKASNSARQNSADANLERQLLLDQTRLYLCTALQASLDIENLLSIFYQHLSQLVGIAGVEFSSKDQCETTLIGTHAIHKFSYQLNTGKQDIGELTCYSRTRVNGLNIDVLEIGASTLIYPLYHALLFKQALEQAETDPLTCLGNRLALDKTLPKLVSSANRHQRPLSILMIDIDHFKTINDKYGHQTGDRVIEAVARTIECEPRHSDMTCRYGGEEFIHIMDNTDIQGAAVVAERLRAAIAEIDTQPLGLTDGEPVTISIGYTQLADNEFASSLVQRADSALYHAKLLGRNRAVMSDPVKL